MRKLACAVLLCWMISPGCSDTARDRLKQWFFEVPDGGGAGDAARPADTRGEPPQWLARASLPESSVPGQRFASLHPPFVRRQCRNCHDSTHRMQIRTDLAEACGPCHERYFSDEVGHPPVEQGLCVECHDPHRSDQRFLLKMPVFDMCMDCHDEPEDLSEPAHTVAEVERCTACHNPHFGTTGLLRPDPAIEIPQ